MIVTRPSGLVVPTGQALAGLVGQSARQVAQDPSAQVETVRHFNQPTGGVDTDLGETVIGDASIFNPQTQPTSDPRVEIEDAVIGDVEIEPVRKPEVLDLVIIGIFERGIKTETPVSPEIVEEIKAAEIEPVRKPEVLDPVIIGIFERGIKTETPVSPEIVEEIKDASIFRSQPQPTSATRASGPPGLETLLSSSWAAMPHPPARGGNPAPIYAAAPLRGQDRRGASPDP